MDQLNVTPRPVRSLHPRGLIITHLFFLFLWAYFFNTSVSLSGNRLHVKLTQSLTVAYIRVDLCLIIIIIVIIIIIK